MHNMHVIYVCRHMKIVIAFVVVKVVTEMVKMLHKSGTYVLWAKPVLVVCNTRAYFYQLAISYYMYIIKLGRLRCLNAAIFLTTHQPSKRTTQTLTNLSSD